MKGSELKWANLKSTTGNRRQCIGHIPLPNIKYFGFVKFLSALETHLECVFILTRVITVLWVRLLHLPALQIKY